MPKPGRFIDKAKAEKEINKFRLIKSNTKPVLKKYIPADTPEAKYFNDDVTSFIFERSMIEALFALTKEDGANALRIYYAAADQTNGTIKEGAASLVLIAAKVEIDKNTGEMLSVENILYSDVIAGGQYPGILQATTPLQDLSNDVYRGTAGGQSNIIPNTFL